MTATCGICEQLIKGGQLYEWDYTVNGRACHVDCVPEQERINSMAAIPDGWSGCGNLSVEEATAIQKCFDDPDCKSAWDEVITRALRAGPEAVGCAEAAGIPASDHRRQVEAEDRRG